jgi:Cys-rich four helix bundle protein (predicted Tat secretion target)
MKSSELQASADAQGDAAAGASDRVLNRRDLLAGTGALAGALASGVTLAAGGEPPHHGMHDKSNGDVLHAAHHCSAEARLCLAHCLAMFAQGDTSLADCATSVNQMASLCDALAAQVMADSNYVGAMAAVCAKACSDCEPVCRKHAEKHQACRACADACVNLVTAIRAMPAPA